ncbi:ThuA domain-containing protein [Draconibacterium halophilum]|uniref:ThuA domain-containing protein n=1 Tax=Draconibacterium halophilum TaxID=2706887 RepID=A0A6C0RA35_9BACT|nr:ThuA domain-containing protein [Draconibacterium halophilum]QIA07438.1 ThuA domain-containing protein [Draconibacterium halophilum]
MNRLSLLIALFFATTIISSAQHEPFDVTEDWIQKIETLAPDAPEATPSKSRKILVFDKFTGFNHWVTPHTSQVIRVLGEKSGAYESEITQDVFCLEAANLAKYDAVVLNNNCSIGPRRDLILDLLDEDKSLSEEQKKKKAKELENNLIEYVKNGGGLIVTHGAIVMQNNSMPFSEMIGGSFDYHPRQQEISLELCDPDHPLTKAFNGKSFVHIDEPYLFNKAYEKKNFRPLLYMDTDKLEGKRQPIEENIRYVAWIKKHGKGRVFYVSPSHNAQSFEKENLLKFYLDGIQYAIGDIECDDSPIEL